MNRVVPLYAIGDPATITIDGIEYRPAVTDAYGHLGIHVLSAVLPALAATSTKQDTMITALQLIDDLQTALESVGTNRLNVNVKATGASEVKSILHQSATDSSVRATVVTPTGGKKIRLISVVLVQSDAARQHVEAYFGTGASIVTSPDKAIADVVLAKDLYENWAMVWPDGGGPVGAVNEVLSFRTGADVTSFARMLAHYREE